MHVTRAIALITVSATAATSHAHAQTRYFELINASYDTVVAVEVSTGGTGSFLPLVFDSPLRGGLHATTLEVPGPGCLHDFRIGFRDGRTLRYPGVDVCQKRGLKLMSRDGKQPRSRPPVPGTPHLSPMPAHLETPYVMGALPSPPAFSATDTPPSP